MSKYTSQEIFEYFKNQGCELLDEYTGVYNKMRYKCKCGRFAVTDWNNFKYGKRCGYCHETGRKKKYALEEIQAIFQQRGCQLLEKEYRSNKTPMRYRCKCGREAMISFVAFYFQNQYCHQCGLEKNKGPGHHDWVTDRNQKRLNDLFRKKCYKALRSTLLKCGQKKVGKTTDLLGYTPQQLQEHIKSHPNWELVKNTDWHLDHIFPIIAFLEHGVRDIKLINHLDNLQPLPGKENISKGDKYDKEKFLKWLNEVTPMA